MANNNDTPETREQWRKAYLAALTAEREILQAQAAMIPQGNLPEQNQQTLIRLKAFRDTYFPSEPLPFLVV